MENRCPQQFQTVARILGVISILAFILAMIYPESVKFMGKPMNHSAFTARLIVSAITVILIFLSVMLFRCRIWAVFVVTIMLFIDIIQNLIKLFFTDKIFNVSIIISSICIYLLVKGYLAYRSDSGDDVASLEEIQNKL